MNEDSRNLHRNRLKVIGLMSGTSADSIDAALVEFGTASDRIVWRLLSHVSFPWRFGLREAILESCNADAPISDVSLLNFRLGEEFAEAALAAASGAGLPIEDVDLIASHGQTIWHQPQEIEIGGRPTRSTFQIGEPAIIAARTNRVVIADFRPADMAVGGLGAPLVPFADHALFTHTVETRVLQNIGGIANATYLAAGGTLDQTVAFDTGPGGVLIDAVAAIVTEGRATCDVDGGLACRGKVLPELLKAYLALDYFSLPPPKTTGRELFDRAFAMDFYSRGRAIGGTPEDIARTATALTVETIAAAYETWMEPRGIIDLVIVSGGGTRNPVLMEMLKKRLATKRVIRSDELGLPEEAKEAVAFALLGYQTLCGLTSNVPAATGALRPAVLGKIVLPPDSGKLGMLLDKAAGTVYNL